MSMLRVAYSTNQVAPADRADHWTSVIAETYFPLQLTFRESAAFQGSLERRTLGAVSLSRLHTEAMQYERRQCDIAGASEEEYLIAIPRSCPIEFHQIGRDVRCDPGGFIIERGDEPYRFSYAARNDLCVLKVAKSALSERLRNPDRYCALVFNGHEGVGGLFTTMAQQVYSDSPEDQRTTQVLGRHLIELLALAVDGQSEVYDRVHSSVRAAHLKRAKQCVLANLSNSGLSPEMVAEAGGISKRYLHVLFSEANSTVSQYIREQRLIAARDLLLTPNSGTLADIAYRFGFSDQAQFSRLFRSMFGQTPTACRSGQFGVRTRTVQILR